MLGAGSLIGVVACCLLAVVAVVGQRWLRSEASYPTDPNARDFSCAGATGLASIAMDRSEAVYVTIALSDPRHRGWRVDVRDWDSYLLPPAAAEGAAAGRVTAAGDRDEGPSRVVRLRPQGASTTCRVDVSLR